MNSTFKFPSHKKIKISKSILRKISNESNNLLKNCVEYPHYIVKGTSNILPLISPNGSVRALQGFSNGENFKETHYLEKAPAIKKFLMNLPGRKFSCRLAELHGNSELCPHRDYFRSLEFGVIRLHLPLKTHKSVSFNFEKKTINLETGYLHFVDISHVHYVINPTQSTRVHLIIDIEVTSELLEMFDVQELISKLPYLSKDQHFSDARFNKIKLNLKLDNLPFPLSTSKSASFELVSFEQKFFLKSSSFEYEVVKLTDNRFQLPAIGPGFYFYFEGKRIVFICHGVAVITREGVKIKTKKQSVDFLKKITKVIYRAQSVVEGETSDKRIFLYDFSRASKNQVYVILNDQALKLWGKLLTPTDSKKLTSIAKSIYKNSNFNQTIKKFKETGFIKEYLFYG
jgi:hypothetical protein